MILFSLMPPPSGHDFSPKLSCSAGLADRPDLPSTLTRGGQMIRSQQRVIPV